MYLEGQSASFRTEKGHLYGAIPCLLPFWTRSERKLPNKIPPLDGQDGYIDVGAGNKEEVIAWDQNIGSCPPRKKYCFNCRRFNSSPSSAVKGQRLLWQRRPVNW